MAVNIVIMVVFGGIGLLLYFFKIKKTLDPEAIKKLLPVSLVIFLIILVDASLAFMAQVGLTTVRDAAPLTAFSEIQRTEDRYPVIVTGFLASENKTMKGDYIAYLDGKNLYTPDRILLELDEGSIFLIGRTYETREWELDYHGDRFIQGSTPVVVMGTLFKTKTKNEEGQEVDSTYINTEMIFSGTALMFSERASKMLFIARIIMSLNLIAAIAVLGLPLYHYILCRMAYGEK